MKQCIYTAILCGLCAASVRAVVTSDELGSHATTPGVSAFGVNVDGVAMIGGFVPGATDLSDLLPFCSGALISDSHILSAAHCFDENENGELDAQFIFPHVAAFELTDRVVMLEIDTSEIEFPVVWPEVYADLAILRLTDPAPPDIPRYSLFGNRNEIGQPIVIVGYGSPGHGPTGLDLDFDELPTKRAGRNTYDDDQGRRPGVEMLVYDFDSGLEAHNAMQLTGFESDLGFGPDEVLATGGDSGGPVFIGSAIAGVTSFGSRLPGADFTSEQDASWGEGGFDSRVSSFREFITTATDGQAVFVPEPSSLIHIMTALSLLTLLLRSTSGLGVTRFQNRQLH